MKQQLFVNRIQLKKENINKKIYPFNIKALEDFDYIEINNPVTFFYGENGVGKSTLIEAIAISMGLNPEGGNINMHFSTYDDYSNLYEHLLIGKFGVPKNKFFLRAESFYNMASSIHNDYNSYDGKGEIDWRYGGNLHECSHGESFLKIIENQFFDKGFYILDEPEAALSPLRQMTLLYHIHDLAKKRLSVNNCNTFANIIVL